MTDLAETILTGILTGLAADALWESGKWAWKHRQKFADKLRRTPEDIVINLQPLTLHAEVQPARITVGSERRLLWNIEAPTQSLARRLEELATWYLHVS
jgi:hypothetical protein